MKQNKKIFALILVLIFLVQLIPAAAQEPALKAGDKVEGFTLTEVGETKAFHSQTYLFTHDKTGAQVMYVANDDTNRAFDIAFRTPAENTGVSHVFEHAVLNGSDNYPANIFFSVANNTFQTFLNAETGMMHTAFPIASLSDEQLLSLTDYYLDAVFHPLILKDKSIFEQEAWRYELDSDTGELKRNGTVYSEMKGAITPVNRTLYNTIQLTYPDSCRSAIAGGDPKKIPTLTYEDVVAYHDAYYKPSNSLSVLYGAVDYQKYLHLLDSYFSKYDDKKPSLADKNYKPITGAAEKTFAMQGNPEAGNTVWYMIPCKVSEDADMFDLQLCAGFMNSESSVLSQNLKEKMPAVSLSIAFNTLEFTEPTFYFAAQNVQDGQEQELKQLIDDSLAEMAETGFNDLLIDANIASLERELLMMPDSGDNMGIVVLENINVHWGTFGDPARYFRYTKYLENLDKTVGDRSKKLIGEHLINPERSTFAIHKPDPNLAAREEAAEKEELAAIKAGMSEEELNRIANRKAKEDDPALVQKLVDQINVCDAASLKQEVEHYKPLEAPYTDENTDGVRYLICDGADIGDIGYVDIYLDVSGFSGEELLYLSLYDGVVGLFDTKEHSAEEMADRIGRYLSGSSQILATDDGVYLKYRLNTLNRDITETYNVLYETLFETEFDDTDYLKAILDSEISAEKTAVFDYNILLNRMRGQSSPRDAYKELISGLSFFDFVGSVREELDNNPQEVAKQLTAIGEKLKNRHGAILAYAGNSAGAAENASAAEAFFARLDDTDYGKKQLPVMQYADSEAIITNADINYNAVFATPEQLGIEQNGALTVALVYLRDKFLMPYLRDEKGAYGIMMGNQYNGIYLVSYRDPQIASTFDFYEQLGDLLEQSEITQKDADGYIRFAFSNLAQGQGGILSRSLDMLERKICTNGKVRYELLCDVVNTTPEQIKAYADTFRKLGTQGLRGTVGNKTDISENADLYGAVTEPFADTAVKLYYNGVRIPVPVEPVREQDRLLVPLRAAFEAMGCEVSWEEAEQKITVSKDGQTTVLWIDNPKMQVNGTAVTLDAPPRLAGDYTMVPVRAISEAVGSIVKWSETTQSVRIIDGE